MSCTPYKSEGAKARLGAVLYFALKFSIPVIKGCAPVFGGHIRCFAMVLTVGRASGNEATAVEALQIRHGAWRLNSASGQTRAQAKLEALFGSIVF